MATERQRNILGYGGLGLFIGVVLFAFWYIITFRAGIAQRFEWSWAFLHLLVLLGPMILLGLYGASRKPAAPL